MSREEFNAHLRANDFAEYDVYGDNLYGTLKSSLEGNQKLVCVVTPEGAEAIKKESSDAFVVHVSTDMKTAVMRAIAWEKNLLPKR